MPITLPAGQVQLDFAHPSGEAVVAVWAVPQRLIDSIMEIAAFVLAIVALIVIRGIWRGRRTGPGRPGQRARSFTSSRQPCSWPSSPYSLLCGGLFNMITVAVIIAIVTAVQTIVARMKAA